MVSKPLVTMGVCVRNSAATIGQAIESIANQNFPHEWMEVIFVDDGSDDATLSIINDYAVKMDMQVKILHHEWKGLGASRNKVVNNARGEYLIWVDGDMILPKDHVTTQVKFMENNHTIGIAKARYADYPIKNFLGFLENAAYMAVDSMYGGRESSRTLGTGGSIYRVKAIIQVGGFDTDIKGVGEDMDAEVRIRSAGWKLYLGTPATFYERRRGSWKSIWDEGFWHGYGGHRIFRKNRQALALYKMIPPAGFVAGTLYSIVAYRLLHRKAVFLMPLQYAFKRTAWCSGFLKGQFEEYRVLARMLVPKFVCGLSILLLS